MRKLELLANLYTHSIGNQPQNMMVVFKMSDSVYTWRPAFVIIVSIENLAHPYL